MIPLHNEYTLPSSGFDGGDCCPCNCDGLPAYICAYYQTFLCVDPSPSCEEDDDFSYSQCVGDFLGDGRCDQENNNEDCGASDFCILTQVAHLEKSDDIARTRLAPAAIKYHEVASICYTLNLIGKSHFSCACD